MCIRDSLFNDSAPRSLGVPWATSHQISPSRGVNIGNVRCSYTLVDNRESLQQLCCGTSTWSGRRESNPHFQLGNGKSSLAGGLESPVFSRLFARQLLDKCMLGVPWATKNTVHLQKHLNHWSSSQRAVNIAGPEGLDAPEEFLAVTTTS